MVHMDIVFVDVGFGANNIILTGSGEAIVIDAGERLGEPLKVLQKYGVKRISHLILSHWHDDHYGGATGLLQHFGRAVSKVWFPFDHKFQDTPFYGALCEAVNNGDLDLEDMQPLVLTEKAPRVIWSSSAFDGDLSLIAPSCFENMKGVASKKPNATSGILMLRRGTRAIVFAGDAELEQWQEVPNRIKTPIQADAFAVPHHAGIMWKHHWKVPQIEKALETLYSKIVQPRVAIISTSTHPGEKHPREEVIKALSNAKASIMCTQMTHRCSDDLEKARSLRQSLPIVVPGRSSSRPVKSGIPASPTNVACAGSVFVEMRDGGTTVHDITPHSAFVTKNAIGKVTPLCKR